MPYIGRKFIASTYAQNSHQQVYSVEILFKFLVYASNESAVKTKMKFLDAGLFSSVLCHFSPA